jgi:nitrate reductase NapAB chaperone NapD
MAGKTGTYSEIRGKEGVFAFLFVFITIKLCKIMNSYVLKVKSEDIDAVVLKLASCEQVEIKNVWRLIGSVVIKAKSLDVIASMNEVLQVEQQKNFYITI